METKRDRCPANSVESSSREILSYGQFYGVLEWKHEIPHFALSVIAPDETAVKGVKHIHEAAHIIFILDGWYALAKARLELTAPPRSLIFVPAGTTHQNHPQTPQTRILTISISQLQIEQARNYVRLPETEQAFRHGEIAFLASRLESECRGWRDTSVLTAEGICLELLAAIAKRNEVKERTPPRWLRTAREILHDRCCGTVSISEIAGAAGVHPIHLSRTFRKFFKCTPGDYLRDCRLEIAASLLRDGREPIAQVALASGFTDQSQLSKAFRRKFGVTPAEFRRSNVTNV